MSKNKLSKKSFYKIPNTNLQLSEDNEWLKLIESGFKIMSHQVKIFQEK